MEKSRAIELLEHLAWDRDIDRNPYGDALNMAIDALEAQLSKEGTTKDTISRRAALDAVEKNACNTQRIMDAVNNLPPAQPETAKRIVGKSRDGMTLWYQCDMCDEPVDEQDNYCRGCGRRLIDG